MVYDLHLCMNRNGVVKIILLNAENEDNCFGRGLIPGWGIVCCV